METVKIDVSPRAASLQVYTGMMAVDELEESKLYSNLVSAICLLELVNLTADPSDRIALARACLRVAHQHVGSMRLLFEQAKHISAFALFTAHSRVWVAHNLADQVRVR
jgi:hypothetical protein